MIEEKVKDYIRKHGFGSFSPKAVLFDMDGVLYDSMPHHAVCWKQAMAEFGIDMPEADTYKYEGMRGVETIQLVVKQQQGRDISEEEAQMMYDEKARLFGLMQESPIMEGVKDLMRQIKADGLQIGIVTGSGQRPLIRRVLHDFAEFVDDRHIVCAYDVKKGKPAPDPYLMGLQKAGDLKPWEGIVVENAPLGVKAGVAAQIFTAAVNSGPLPDSALADQGANIVLPRMTELSRLWPEISACRDMTL